MNLHHTGPLAAPSPWLVRWSHLLAPHSRVLDVAYECGLEPDLPRVVQRIAAVHSGASDFAASPAPLK